VSCFVLCLQAMAWQRSAHFCFAAQNCFGASCALLIELPVPLYGPAYAQTVSERILSVVAVIVLARSFKKLYHNSAPAKVWIWLPFTASFSFCVITFLL